MRAPLFIDLGSCMSNQAKVERVLAALHHDFGQGLLEDYDSLTAPPRKQGRPPHKALAEFNANAEEEMKLFDQARTIARALVGSTVTEAYLYSVVCLRHGRNNARILTTAIIAKLRDSGMAELTDGRLTFNGSTTNGA